MTDHASLLRQIRQDARPYIEQALNLAEVFTGFRKLATENGLDWGVIKALIKAEVQDEKEGGNAKVERIIDKADFATAYADMLGLGSAKMNENNFSSAQAGVETGSSLVSGEEAKVSSSSPPHDPTTGEIIEEVPANGPATAPAPGAGGEPAKGDAGESLAMTGRAGLDASPNIPQPVAPQHVTAKEPAVSVSPSLETAGFPELPDFLRRVA